MSGRAASAEHEPRSAHGRAVNKSTRRKPSILSVIENEENWSNSYSLMSMGVMD